MPEKFKCGLIFTDSLSHHTYQLGTLFYVEQKEDDLCLFTL